MACGTRELSFTATSITTAVGSVTTSQARPLSVSDHFKSISAVINQKLSIAGLPTKVVSLGETQVPQEIFMELLKDISEKYTERSYHVFTNNCNTFTDEVATLVIGEGIPREYSQLPREFFQTQLGQ